MRKKINNKAQFHVLEGVTAIALLFVSFYFVFSISTAPTASPNTSAQLSTLADEAFYILKYTPGSDYIIPVSEACVGWWDFEEGSGNIAYDSSGHNNNGTIYGDRIYTTNNVQGTYALSFDGINDYINCGNDEELNLTDEFSLAAWINCEDPSLEKNFFISKGYQYALGIYNGTGERDPDDKPIDPKNRSTFVWYNETDEAYYNYSDMSNLTNSTWYHIAITYGNSELRFYVNGVEEKIYYPIKTPYATDDPLRIGVCQRGAEYWFFKGDIDNVCIWNQTLSDEEIEASYILGINSQFENILTQWIITNDEESRDDFEQELSRLLPNNVFFQVKIFDGYNTYWWYEGEKQELANILIRSHHIISHETYIYSVELEMWNI